MAKVAQRSSSGGDTGISISNQSRESDPKVPDAWKTTRTSNRHAYDRRWDTTLLLRSDEFVLDDKVDFSTTTLLVYAETVRITHDCNFPGKTVQIFCNKLKLSRASASVSLGVSGDNGQNVLPNQPTGKDANGKNGGTITIYVEELDDELIPRTDDKLKKTGLYLHARGGNGGKGANMSSGAGGVGGNGGSGVIPRCEELTCNIVDVNIHSANASRGGIIQFYFGHGIYEEINQLAALVDEKDNWWARMLGLSKFAFGSYVPVQTASKLKDFAKAHAGIQERLIATQSALGDLIFKGAPNHDDLLNTRDDLQTKVGSVLKITAEPILIDFSELKEITETIEKFRSRGRHDTEPPWSVLQAQFEKFTGVLKKLLAPLSSETSEFRKKLEEIDQAHQEFVREIKSAFSTSYSVASRGGTGGSGGAPSSTNFGNGASGKSGERSAIQKSALVRPLSFAWRTTDVKISTVLAHPDECQMLLNVADDKYFAAGQGGDMTEAKSLYRRLSKRLGFIDFLVDKQDGAASELALAYAELARKQLTFQPLVQLSAIREHADRCLDQINQNQDLFGNVANWVPRLSYTFYQSRISGLTARIKALEESLKIFKTDPSDAINKTISNARTHAEDSRDEVALLKSKNGPLETAIAQIDTFTPMLKAKKALLNTLLKNAAEGLKHRWNTDPKNFLDAISMIAMGHGWFNAGAQLGLLGYKMVNTVRNAKGEDVDKKYVVSQFIDAGTTFRDLETAYKSRLDATIEVDDPSSAKLLAAEKDVNKLLSDFVDNVPANSRDTIKTELGLYKVIVKQRNDAVMLYNATLNVLWKSREDQEYYEKIARTTSDDLLQADSDIPALIFWTRKAIRDLHHLALQYLSFGRRALSYWAIADKKSTSTSRLSVQELFPPWEQIDDLAGSLSKSFDAALSNYASNVGFTFPSLSERAVRPRPLGRRHDFSSEDITALKFRQSSSTGKGYYSIDVTVPAPEQDTDDSQSKFAKQCNVRLDQVHVWLLGAAVRESTHLTVNIKQLGTEVITGQDYTPYTFMHDPISLSFRYNPDKVNSWDSVGAANIIDSQNFPNVFLGQKDKVETNSMATIGPFATWRITVSEQFNNGLDMKGLHSAALEFWGCAQEAN